jgi:hypothetical protein
VRAQGEPGEDRRCAGVVLEVVAGSRDLRGVLERMCSQMARRVFAACCGGWFARGRAGRGLTVVACLGSALAMGGCGSRSGSSHTTRAPERGAAGPSGTLYVSSTQSEPRTVTIIDAATGRLEVRGLRELSPGDAPYAIAVIAGQLVVYGRLATYSLGARVREPGRRIGPSWFFLPSATRGRVWLVSLNARDPSQAHGLGGVRELTLAGKVTLAHSARPPYTPVGAVQQGLLVQGPTLEVWQPASGRIVRRLPGVFPMATRGSLVASCTARCAVLHITNTRDGSDLRIRPGPGFRFVSSYDGAFSPDGRLVAVPAAADGNSRVAIVDIARRHAKLLAGADLASDYTLLAWASTGWLFFNAGHGRLAAYRPGHARATILPFRVHRFQHLAAR